jgi:hypothetical protein
MGGMGLRTSGRRWFSLKKAPRPAQDEKNWFVNGAYMTPMSGLDLWMKAMLTQNIGKRWM